MSNANPAPGPIPQAQPPRRWPWMAIALVISLGVNLLIVGMAAGHWMYRHDGHHMGGRFGGGPGEGRHFGMMRSFPPEVREEMEKLMREKRAKAEPLINEMRQARKAAREALEAEPFDPAKLDVAFANMRKSSQELQETFHAAMVEAAGRLPPEARKRLAEMRHRRGDRH